MGRHKLDLLCYLKGRDHKLGGEAGMEGVRKSGDDYSQNILHEILK